jgi:hypothetical protein
MTASEMREILGLLPEAVNVDSLISVHLSQVGPANKTKRNRLADRGDFGIDPTTGGNRVKRFSDTSAANLSQKPLQLLAFHPTKVGLLQRR